MEENEKYRHEYKYHISVLEKTILINRVNGLLDLDKHVGKKGQYHISSLYFDTLDNRCYYENENGTDPREKYRIRMYNQNTDRISLECKRKEHGKTLKNTSIITLNEVNDILRGNSLKITSGASPVLMKFVGLIETEQLAPKVIVEYDRTPYVYKMGNVRVTFDENLTAASETSGFLSGDYIRRPVFPVGESLLEVKYDEFLPDVVYRSLQIDKLTQTAFSKYYLCRKFTV